MTFHRLLHTLAGAALALAIATPAAAQPRPAAVAHLAKPAFPVLNLPDRQSQGQRAVDLLGDRLPEVAAWYRKSPDEFRALLRNDRSMRLDQRGRVFIVEELDAPLPATTVAAAASTGLVDGTLAPLDQTFLLHSRAGARRTVYLNFRGATLTGTAWNGSAGSINALPFDLDGVPGTFSTAELQRIQAIWQRVAEDFAPFDVNVTTEAPPPEALSRSDTSDLVFGTTVLVTSSVGVYSCSCGGVAYLGVFDDYGDYYKPALVFYDKLGPGSEKYVAEAISHEAGHNLGLSHDGTSTIGYYRGHGSGATGWAPIMGVGYYQALSQWSRGEYADANNREDDLAVMQTYGLPLRADDHGDTLASATVLAGSSSGGVTSATVLGVIGRETDVDAFALAAAAGPLTVALSPAARAANLDAQLTLHDAAGNLLASVNPADALNATLSHTLPAAGTYFLAVRGVGKGDPLATGYSAYGSLGQYALSASYPTAANTAPRAVITSSALSGAAPLGVSFSGAASSDTDGSVVAWDWTFGDGGTASGATTSHVYTVPGSYTAMLRVTDNGGLSSTTSVTVNVGAAAVAMHVGDIAMSRSVARNGQARATAVVTVRDAAGQPVSGVTVAGTWSGVVGGSVSGVTGSNGSVGFTSGSTRATSGSFVFTVTGASRSGYSYQSASNVETSDAISVR